MTSILHGTRLRIQYGLLSRTIGGFPLVQKKWNFTIWVNKHIHLILKTLLNNASNAPLESQ
jgi:hypothetical protein